MHLPRLFCFLSLQYFLDIQKAFSLFSSTNSPLLIILDYPENNIQEDQPSLYKKVIVE